MPRIPIYVDGRLGLIGPPRYDEWKLLRWTVSDGAQIAGETIVAEIECEIAVVEHEVFYSGTLRHLISDGQRFTTGTPIGAIECTEDEFADYLRSENARRICLTVEPAELAAIERLRGSEAVTDFALRVLREGLKQIEP
jgi:pyruvate/2-oxoglutarate dehydrogenase complex dihydrolipoamide acyltransferase (E2) component